MLRCFRYLVFAAAALAVQPASAAVVTLTNNWQSLGNSAPVLLQAFGCDAVFENSGASAPTDAGHALGQSQVPFAYNTAAAVWVKLRGSCTSSSGQARTGTLIYSPVIVGGGGGGGGGAITAPLGANTKANSVSTTFATDFLGQNVMAGSVPVTIASDQSVLPVRTPDTRSNFTLDLTKTSGTGSFIDITLNGNGIVGLGFTGLSGSGATVTYTSSNSAAVTPTSPISSLNAATGVTSGTRTTDGETRIPISGRTTLRLAVTTAGTGTASGYANVTGIAVSGIVDVGSPLPAGNNLVGGANLYVNGALNASGNPAFVSVTNFPATQPVSGTVAANQGAPAAVGNAWPIYLSQGGAVLSSTNGLPTTDTNAAQTITSPGTSASKAQGVQFATGGLPFPVTGTFFQATQPVSTSDGAQVTLGSKSDTAAGTGTISAMQIFKQMHLDLIAATPAGTNIIGKVTTDQTTHGTTDKVAADLYAGGSAVTATAPVPVYQVGLATGGITAVVSSAAETGHVGKASAGALVRAYATAPTAPAAQQYLVCVASATVPTSGATIVPVDFAPFNLATTAGSTAQIGFGSGPLSQYASGISCVVSTAIYTYTPGTASVINIAVK